MWFIFSLIAVLFWSGSDLFSKMGSDSEDKNSHWKLVMFVGGVMGIHAIVMLLLGTEFHLQDIITYLPASVLYILSMTLGYVGLRYIMLSVSTPICNSSGAVACIMFYFLMKEPMEPPQIVAVVMICLAVFLLAVLEKREEDRQRKEAVERKYTHSFLAIFLPIAYCILDALGTYVDGVILDGTLSEDAANIAYELTFLAMAIFSFIFVVVIKKEKIFLSKEKPKAIAACCETAGQFAYVYALAANPVVAAPMISSYCLFSLIWARIILKEKLKKPQYAVIFLAIVGIVILGVYDV